MGDRFLTLDASGFPATKAPTDLGCATQLIWVSIKDFVVDRSYQREITKRGRNNILKIAKAFNWSCFSPVVASPIEGGRYAIVDGQHRTLAAMLLAIEKVPAAIVIMNSKEQAEAFRAINGNFTRISRYQLFHAEIKGGRSESLKMAEICDKLGIKIVFNMAKPEFLAVSCITTLEFVLKNKGEEILVLALRCLVKAAEKAPMKVLRAEAVVGLSNFLEDNKMHTKDAEAFVGKFGAIHIEAVCQEVREEYAKKRGVKRSDLFYAKMCEMFKQASILKVA